MHQDKRSVQRLLRISPQSHRWRKNNARFTGSFQKLQAAFVNVDGGKAILDKYPRGSLREHLQDASALLQDLEGQQSALASSATSDPNQLGLNVLQLCSTVEKIVEKVFYACCKTRKKIRQQKFLNALRTGLRFKLFLIKIRP